MHEAAGADQEDTALYSDRGRIGAIVLDSDITVEPEFRMMAPPGVEVFATRVAAPHDLPKPEYLRALCDQVRPAVRVLLATRPSAVVFCCTSASFLGGPGWDERLCEDMRTEAGAVPVTTPSTGIGAALRQLGLRRLVVGTPYLPEINERLRSYLTSRGYDVLRLERIYRGPSDSVDEDLKMASVPPAEMRDFMVGLDRPEADGVLISCTALPAAAHVAEVEAKLGKPVVTSNLAAMWHALTISGIGAIRKGFGRLGATLHEQD
jgi:maleate cis-trans isomerase